MKLTITHAGTTSTYEPRADLGIIVIGRAEGSDIRIEGEKAASRKHATLERTVDGWKLVDQMSSNGTALNGDKVNFAFLRDGDEIAIGETRIKVVGIQSAAPVQSLAAVVPARVPQGRSMSYVPPRRAPVGAIVGICVVVLVVVGALYFVFNSGGPVAPIDSDDVAQLPRKAELSAADRDAIAAAKSIAASGDSTVEKIHRMQALQKKHESRRGSVALSEIDSQLGKLWKALDSEIDSRVTSGIADANETAAGGDYLAAHTKLLSLQAWLDGEKDYAPFRPMHVKKIDAAVKETLRQSSAWFDYTLMQMEELAEQFRFDEALAVADEIPKRAVLDDADRRLYEARKQQLINLKSSHGVAQVKEPEPEEVPDVASKFKKDESKLPGRNPLFPDGPGSEAQLKAELRHRTIQATMDKRLTDTSFLWRGDKARILRATPERIYIDVSTKDKRTGEEIAFGTSKAWDDLAPAEMLQLYDRVPGLTPELRLAIAVYAFDVGLTDEGSRRALAVWKLQNDWKEGIDILVASKRRIEMPEGGFVEHEGMLVTPVEKEEFEFRTRLKGVLERFERGINSKDKRKREDSEAAFNELVAMGERAVPGAIKVLDEVLKDNIARAETAAGLAGADGKKMDMLLDELDKRRAYALELIFDTVKYPYPYGPNQAEVQADVDERVASVREIWDDPTGFLGQANPEYEAVIEKVRLISERMDQLDPSNAYHQSTSEDTLEYLRGQANKKLTIRTWPGSGRKYEQLINLNRRVMQANEEFPTGDGHTDADGREQVRITNEYRMMFARVALKLNDKLFWAAWHHSKYCVEHNGGQIAHVIKGEPRGEGPGDRMAYEGYSGGGGENIHMNSAGPTAQSSHNGWVHSSGHHRNILNPAWRALGSGKYQTIWTQNFGSVDEGDANSVSKGGK